MFFGSFAKLGYRYIEIERNVSPPRNYERFP